MKPKYQHIQLVNASYDNPDYRAPRAGCLPPLALLALASFLKHKLPDIKVEILDGDILNQQELEKRIHGDLVGVSPHLLSYHNSLSIAEKAKNNGATVVFGGNHATMLAEAIVNTRGVGAGIVDAVVSYDGEVSLYKIVRGDRLTDIENLVFNDGHAIVRNKLSFPGINSLPFIDLNLFDSIAPYWDNFRRLYVEPGYYPADIDRPALISSHRGCSFVNRQDGGNCLFCSRVTPQWRFRNSSCAWDEIACLCKTFNVNFIWDTSDSFTHNKKWLMDFCKEKSSNPALKEINPYLAIYARADDLCDERIVDDLVVINCFQVFVGFESGDPEMLGKTNKETTIEDNIKAAVGLSRRGIELLPSFVLGLPGETKSSLRRTLDFARGIVENGNVVEISSSLLVPLPGSRAFQELLKALPQGQANEILHDDNLDFEHLTELWAIHFCNVEYDYLREINRDILGLVKIQSGAGAI